MEHACVRATSNRPAAESQWMRSLAKEAPPPDTLPLPMHISLVQTQTGDLQPQMPKEASSLSRISKEEYAQFDIDPAKIESGEDLRTTVMIRNLTGTEKRSDLLKFLQNCKLGSRHSFFYVPCKSHRNVYAGFAFVNFLSPNDVLTIRNAVMTQPWCSNSSKKGSKMLAVSYAKIQGLDQLRVHFSSSVASEEPNPTKRPIFRAIDTLCSTGIAALNTRHSTPSHSCPTGKPPWHEHSNQASSNLSVLTETDRLFTQVLFDDESSPCRGHSPDGALADAFIKPDTISLWQ